MLPSGAGTSSIYFWHDSFLAECHSISLKPGRRGLNLPEALEVAKRLAREAGQVILNIRLSGADLQISMKQGWSDLPPSAVTVADLASSNLICSGLRRSYPEHGVVSEETIQEAPGLLPWWKQRYAWIIDPLDGTKEFIRGGDHFGVHIGLTEEGRAILGVNYYPTTDTLYWALEGEGAYKQEGSHLPNRLLLHSQATSHVPSPLASSDRNSKALYERIFGRTISVEEFSQFPYLGSTGLRLCTIADGSQSLYVSDGSKGGLWDVLSGNAILSEAGGYLTNWEGNPINYQQPEARLEKGFVACGSANLLRLIVSRLG